MRSGPKAGRGVELAIDVDEFDPSDAEGRCDDDDDEDPPEDAEAEEDCRGIGKDTRSLN